MVNSILFEGSLEITTKEYLQKIDNCKIDESKMRQIEKIYGPIIDDIKRILSLSSRSIFFSDKDGYRTLSIGEIIDASKDLHIDFKKEKIIPIIDCGDNDFIVFHLDTKTYSKYNIVDKTIFKEKSQLKNLL